MDVGNLAAKGLGSRLCQVRYLGLGHELFWILRDLPTPPPFMMCR